MDSANNDWRVSVLENIGPGTVLVILGSQYGLKLFGPSIAYLGDEIKVGTEVGVANLKRIFDSALRKLGSKADEPGQVPPRVLKGILEDGPYCDDEVTAEYLAGVLASSRSEAGKDDRGVVFIEMLSRMSTFQIRAHYIFYTILKELCDGTDKNIGMSDEALALRVFVSYQSFDEAMGLSSALEETTDDLAVHILLGLRREDLIDEFAGGSADILVRSFPGLTESGVTFVPTGTGVELYLWGQGLGDAAISRFLNRDLEFDRIEGVNIPPGSRYISQPDSESE